MRRRVGRSSSKTPSCQCNLRTPLFAMGVYQKQPLRLGNAVMERHPLRARQESKVKSSARGKREDRKEQEEPKRSATQSTPKPQVRIPGNKQEHEGISARQAAALSRETIRKVESVQRFPSIMNSSRVNLLKESLPTLKLLSFLLLPQFQNPTRIRAGNRCFKLILPPDFLAGRS